MTKRTQGRWKWAYINNEGKIVIYAPEGMGMHNGETDIAVIYCAKGKDRDEANAAMLAASTELYEACDLAFNALVSGLEEDNLRARAAIRAAMKKADGDSE